MNHLFITRTSSLAFIFGAVLLQGCGSNGIGTQLVKSLSVRSTPQQNDVLVSVSAELNTGNLVFPLINLPIVDPKMPTRPYGNLMLQRTVDGKNVLTAEINVSRISNTDGILAPNLLPNGNQIPVAGVKDLIAFQAGSSSRVYLSLNDTTKMLGVAVAVKEFDSVAQYVPGANLFFDMPQTNGIRGLAGIFTGTRSGESGFGIFIDATQALQDLVLASTNRVIKLEASSTSKIREPKRSSAVASAQAIERSVKASEVSTIRFISGSNQNSSRTQKLQSKAYQLGQQHRRITVER
jgi:hypothetical protein